MMPYGPIFSANKLFRRPPLLLPVVALATLSLFLAVHERELAGFDPASFVLAMKYGYSVDALRPHPPGYPAFYLLWTAIRITSGLAPHAVLLATNMFFALLALVLIYWAANQLFGKCNAGLAVVLAASNLPLLYYGSVGEMYAYDAAFSAFMVILLLVSRGRTELLLYVIYGILGSFRLSSVVLTLPAVAAHQGIRLYKTRQTAPLVRNASAFIFGTLLWLIPFVTYLGGWSHFWRLFIEASNPQISVPENLAVFLGTTLWMLGVPGILALVKARNRYGHKCDPRARRLALLIIVPAIFFAFRYVTKGYELILLAPMVMLFAQCLRSSRPSIIAFAILGNILLFFFAPFIAPSIKSVLNHRSRTERERFGSALLRYTSALAPTLAHISVSDNSMKTAKQLIRSLPLDATVFVDNGAAFWAFPRSLQVDFPKMNFLYPLSGDSMHVTSFSGANTCDTLAWSSIERLPLLYYLSDSDLDNDIGKLPGTLLLDEHRLVLYDVPQTSIPVLRAYAIRFFIRE